MLDPDPPASWGGDPIPLAQARTAPSPFDSMREWFAHSIAQKIDLAVLNALHKRGLSLSDAAPRLSRRLHGNRCTVLLDGADLVRFGPPRFDWSDDGRVCTASIESQEAT